MIGRIGLADILPVVPSLHIFAVIVIPETVAPDLRVVLRTPLLGSDLKFQLPYMLLRKCAHLVALVREPFYHRLLLVP